MLFTLAWSVFSHRLPFSPRVASVSQLLVIWHVLCQISPLTKWPHIFGWIRQCGWNPLLRHRHNCWTRVKQQTQFLDKPNRTKVMPLEVRRNISKPFCCLIVWSLLCCGLSVRPQKSGSSLRSKASDRFSLPSPRCPFFGDNGRRKRWQKQTVCNETDVPETSEPQQWTLIKRELKGA